jgi:hypothetical protein
MVDRWGKEAFMTFYRDIHPVEENTQSGAIDAALQVHFGMSFADLEADFLTILRRTEISPAEVEDVRLTVAFYDTVRRYQQTFDPSAYFLTAWLPDGPYMRENGIIADLVRHPAELENLTLETMLVAADQAASVGDLDRMAAIVSAVNQVLDAFELEAAAPFDVHPMGRTYFQITTLLFAHGYQVQWIEIHETTAQAAANQGWPTLTYFEFVMEGGNWVLNGEAQ